MSNKKEKLKKFMRKKNRLICMFFAIELLLACMISPLTVQASLDNGYCKEVNDDYDFYKIYDKGGYTSGRYQCRLNMDFTGIDSICVNNYLVAQRCCSNMPAVSGDYFTFRLNGNTICYETGTDIVDNIDDSKPERKEFDISGYGFTIAEFEYDMNVGLHTCPYCGKRIDVRCYVGPVMLIDYRGKVTSMQTEASTNEGGSVTITPEFSSQTTKIKWAIKFPNELGYTTLKEGSNSKGIVASGVNSTSLTLSNIPFISGGIDVGPFTYDKNGNLPAGTDANSMPFSTHINIIDITPPSIDVKKTVNKDEGTVTLSISGSDSGGLDQNPYSFDGGGSFGSITSKTFTTAGTYRLMVKDLSGNLSFKDIDILANEIDTIKPTIEVKKTIDREKGLVWLTISGQDAGGFPANPYSFDGGATFVDYDTKAFDTHGKYKMAISDAAGNISYKEISIEKIELDNEGPELEVKKTIDRTNGVVKLTASAKDSLGLAEKPYSFDGGKNFVLANQYTVTSPGKIVVVAKDLAGNTSKKEVEVSNTDLDNIKPDIDVIKTINKEKGTVTLTIKAKDAGGFPSKPYSFDGGTTFVENDTKTFSTYGKYKLAVTDAAGNISYKEISIDKIELDNEPPELEVKKTIDRTNGVVKLTATAKDSLGLSEKPYSFDGGKNFVSSNQSTVTSPGKYLVLAKDLAGNISKKEVEVSSIDLDNIKPDLEVTKTINKEAGTVILTISGHDTNGLPEDAYSFDGGKTFDRVNLREYSSVGKYSLAVRDKAGNISTKDVYIDLIDISKAKLQAAGGGETDNEKDTGKVAGTTQSKTTGTNDKGNDNSNKTSLIDKISGLLSKSDNESKEFDNIKKADTGETTKESTIKNSETGTASKSTSDSGKSTKNTADNKDKDTLNPKSISEKDSSDTFEKIRNNSEQYIISMKETNTSDKKGADSSKADISLEEIEEEKGEENSYEALSESDNLNYNPKKENNAAAVIILTVFLILLLIIILLFVLFFGVIILVEKETEYSKLSDIEGFKMPVAISFVVRRDGQYSVCFRELLEKYGLVYARFGVLFAYMYEGEKIRIMTRFKGEDKREIATERIAKEIVVGQKGGRKK